METKPRTTSAESFGSVGGSGTGSSGCQEKRSLQRSEAVEELLGKSGFAYRVLAVQSGSPSDVGELVPWFDFIVAAARVNLVSELAQWDEEQFPEVVRDYENLRLRLTVFNCKNSSLRNVIIVPNKWNDVHGAKGEGLTGLKVAFMPLVEDFQVVQVLNVIPRSPAYRAGLQDASDYLLATSGGMWFKTSEELQYCLFKAVNQTVHMLVYSELTDTVRIVPLVPSNTWSGKGLLGCDIGVGKSFVLPPECRETTGRFHSATVALDPVDEEDDYLSNGTRGDPRDLGQDLRRKVQHQVKTPLGFGQIHGELDNTLVVELDWKLAHSCVVVAFTKASKCKRLPDLGTNLA
mmetsp:Transcript_18659/g.34572  ORF Transcript_18659/g.34572 Transcript_18659/m.34572 type:complete len:348 (-) Transcript_18659:573-1616(-)